jgi:hypothetical protein
MGKIVKSRHWAFVAYPESVEKDWIEQLKLSGLKCAISPLHDKDEHSNPEVEEEKKAHWHVIVSWRGPTTYETVFELTKKIKAKKPIKLSSVMGYYRYFTHADDPDKYQYDNNEIQCIGGFDIADHSEMSRGERRNLLGEVQDYIRKYNIQEYADLLDTLRDNGMIDHWEIAVTNTLVFRAYIASRRHQAGGRMVEADE